MTSLPSKPGIESVGAVVEVWEPFRTVLRLRGMVLGGKRARRFAASAILVLGACSGPSGSQEAAQAPVTNRTDGSIGSPSNQPEATQWRLLHVIRSGDSVIKSPVDYWSDPAEFDEFWATTGASQPAVDFDSEVVIALRALQPGSCLDTVVDVVVVEGVLTVETGYEDSVSNVGRLNDSDDMSANACRLSATTTTFFVAINRDSLPGNVVVSAIVPLFAGEAATYTLDTTES